MEPVAVNRLFRLMMHVGRGTNTEMRGNAVGAYVPVFVGAVDPDDAARRVVSSLASRGFEVIGIGGGKVDELDPNKWDSFVKTAWPELAVHFPAQAQVLAEIGTGFLFVGPFAAYEASDNT